MFTECELGQRPANTQVGKPCVGTRSYQKAQKVTLGHKMGSYLCFDRFKPHHVVEELAHAVPRARADATAIQECLP